MKLFLSGGGIATDSLELDKKFVASLDLSKPLLYIPIAINSVRHPYPECLAWVENALNPLGIENITMWAEDDLKKKTLEDFEQFGGIYIGGGNTYKLLKELREFGTLDIFHTLANRNVPIYGGSAGAIIFAKTIIPAGFMDENVVGLTDFSALNLIKGYDLWCHYDETQDEAVESFIKDNDLDKIIAIPENGGLIVTGDGIEEVGPGKIKYFDKK